MGKACESAEEWKERGTDRAGGVDNGHRLGGGGGERERERERERGFGD